MPEGPAQARGEAVVWAWRHPKPRGAQGRCIGRTDLAVDPRKAKRLAHRIRAAARRAGWPAQVWLSPLARSRAVGGWLRRWGWQCTVDARLAEMDFGAWEGRPWTQIPWAEVEAWQREFLHGRPGGGESLAGVAARARGFISESSGAGARRVVGHAGWINAALHVDPAAPDFDASRWPAAPRHGSLTRIGQGFADVSRPGMA